MAGADRPVRRHRLHRPPDGRGDGRARAEAGARGPQPATSSTRSPAELGGDLETPTADVTDPPSVAALVEPGDVLVTTVGPFVRWGQPAAAAATTVGAHYIDSTGEPRLHPRGLRALRAGRRRRPASRCSRRSATTGCPATSPAALALDRAGELATRVDVGYFITGGGASMSGGTKASTVGAIAAPGVRVPRRTRADRARRQARSQLPGGLEGAGGRSRSAAPSTSRCRAWRRGCAM